MTACTIGGELQGLVIRIRRLVIVRLVAAGAGVRCVIVVAVVAGRTVIGDQGMCTIQRVIVVVDGKGCR